MFTFKITLHDSSVNTSGLVIDETSGLHVEPTNNCFFECKEISYSKINYKNYPIELIPNFEYSCFISSTGDSTDDKHEIIKIEYITPKDERKFILAFNVIFTLYNRNGRVLDSLVCNEI